MALPLMFMESRRRFLKMAGFGTALSLLLGKGKYVLAKGNVVDASSDQDKIKAILTAKDKPVIWLFTGDSITHGAKHTRGYRSYPEIFGERIRWEMRRMKDVVINTGISGNTTRAILTEMEWRITQFRPAVVSLMYGTNDCVRMTTAIFEENLIQIVKQIREAGAVPILHTPNILIPEKDQDRGAALPSFVPVIRKVAAEQGVILVDNYLHWEDSMKNDTVNVYREWLNDPIHPGEKGHQEIARLLFKELGIFDPKHPTCGAEYYEGEH
jgi:acyl-CoA thioesterase-1